MKIKWLALALKDLESMYAYVSRDKPEAAEREIVRILDSVSSLENFPASGRPGRVPDTRELVVSPYIVAYRVKNSNIQILRVLHATMQWPEKL